jgi:hypothetical protein
MPPFPVATYPRRWGSDAEAIVRHFLVLAVIAVGLGACARQAPPDDSNFDNAEDNALAQIQGNAQQVQAAGVILSDPNVGKPASGAFANVQ